MKIALCQINTTIGDFEGNCAKIAGCARRARDAGADLAVFHELTLPSYPPRDLLESRAFVERNGKALDSLLPVSRDIPLVVGYVEPHPGKGKEIFNACALLAGGQVVHRAYKSLLPTYDVFDEARYFEPTPSRLPVTFQGVSFGLTLCEDAWNDEHFWPRRRYRVDPVEDLVKAGARIILNLSASPFQMGKGRFREEMFGQSARRLGVPMVQVNQVGGNDELIFDGASFAVDATGEVRVRLKAFEEDMAVFEPSGAPGTLHDPVGEETDAVRKALVLGIRDYLRKCGFEEVVIGLSGGIDSAVVAALAAEALGPTRVHGVAMPSRYSSPQSLSDATALARNLGISLLSLPIDPIFQAYLDGTAEVFRDKPEDETEENFQARIRGNLLMGLSNKFGWIVLSTGNKSELAVGYCTLYGDMSGGLAVLADVPKTLVYKIARLYGDAIPRSILERAPSAELKPDQTDQDTLPPYDILDRILKAYVEEGKDPMEISDGLGIDLGLVRKIVRMVDRNEYKRRQGAPVLKVTSKAFGPGRRFPIARSLE
ncbi:MAG: NAD+ synthase [Planctomycetota bacterium]|jgi:NAD+ synthetase